MEDCKLKALVCQWKRHTKLQGLPLRDFVENFGATNINGVKSGVRMGILGLKFREAMNILKDSIHQILFQLCKIPQDG